MKVEELAIVVDDLIGVMHLLAKELEQLITHVEQVTARLPEESEMSVIRSALSGLRVRVKTLRAEDFADIREATEAERN